MSVEALRWWRDNLHRCVTAFDKLVLQEVCYQLERGWSDRNNSGTINRRDVARALDVNRQSVDRSVKRLQASGLIHIEGYHRVTLLDEKATEGCIQKATEGCLEKQPTVASKATEGCPLKRREQREASRPQGAATPLSVQRKAEGASTNGHAPADGSSSDLGGSEQPPAMTEAERDDYLDRLLGRPGRPKAPDGRSIH